MRRSLDSAALRARSRTQRTPTQGRPVCAVWCAEQANLWRPKVISGCQELGTGLAVAGNSSGHRVLPGVMEGPESAVAVAVGLRNPENMTCALQRDTMFARGLKRKCRDSEEDMAGAPAMPSYNLQRQSLLDMSLVKLQLCHTLVEPNLCRSVLIANTVRQIQEEMTQDGAWQLPAPPVAGRGPLDRLVSTEILCRAAWEQQGQRPAPDLPSELPGALGAPAPGSAQSCIWEADSSRGHRGSFPKSLDQIFETLESRAPSPVEGLFADADGPYYDLDAVLTGMVGGRSGPGGDGLQALAPAGAPPPGASCKRDLGELDHVVEILVET